MDPRYERIEQVIYSTTIELLKTHTLSEITVSELCKKAGINRNTFYAHYKNPVEVLEKITVAFLDDFEKIVEDAPIGKDSYVNICRYIYERRDVFLLLIAANAEGRYIKIALDHARKSAACGRLLGEVGLNTTYYNEFVIGGYYFVLRRWAETGANESPEEMGEIIYDFLNGKKSL